MFLFLLVFLIPGRQIFKTIYFLKNRPPGTRKTRKNHEVPNHNPVPEVPNHVRVYPIIKLTPRTDYVLRKMWILVFGVSFFKLFKNNLFWLFFVCFVIFLFVFIVFFLIFFHVYFVFTFLFFSRGPESWSTCLEENVISWYADLYADPQTYTPG